MNKYTKYKIKKNEIDELMKMMKYLIVQPWFIEPGHPAQSLINTYRSIKSKFQININVIVYVPQKTSLKKHLKNYILECNAEVISSSLKIIDTLFVGTIATVRAICKKNYDKDAKIFFLDANLYVLSLALKFYKIKPKKLDVLCMCSPEFYKKNIFKWFLIVDLFGYQYFNLFLRTPELADSWRRELPMFANRIDYLPSLELINTQPAENKKKYNSKTFIIAGQIRYGKCVEYLTNLFLTHPYLGNLRIVGKIVNNYLNDFIQKRNGKNIFIVNDFISENQLYDELQRSHYNLMLYDPWDERMECSMLFNSIKSSCPVIAFKEGWLGRQVTKHCIGWTLPKKEKANLLKFIESLPEPNSQEYKKIINNLQKCYDKWSSGQIVMEFINKLDWH
ncbi:MAG: hypothetical protein ABIM30_03460 [candidate division WOR-3 bacterium]